MIRGQRRNWEKSCRRWYLPALPLCAIWMIGSEADSIGSFRYKFEEVLSRVLAPVIPQIHSPYVKKDTIEERLDADEIDTLILTTCMSS